MLPLIEKAEAAEEPTPALKAQLGAAEGGGADRLRRHGASASRPRSCWPTATRRATRNLLLERLAPGAEADAQVRAALRASLDAVESRLAWGERLGVLFTGASLGSILLLVALGLAITYGLMGVINMAHGELMMIGAYATYVVQNLFRAYAPGAFDCLHRGRDAGRVRRRRRRSARCSSAA